MGFTTDAGTGSVFFFELPQAVPLPVDDRLWGAARPPLSA